MSVGRLACLVVDCADPAALAVFWAAVLGRPVAAEEEPGWASLEPAGEEPGGAAWTLAFQRVADRFRAPRWPGQQVPQQMHLDVLVEDLDEGHERVLALGATVLSERKGSATSPWRVYADPAGHPFCLVTG